MLKTELFTEMTVADYELYYELLGLAVEINDGMVVGVTIDE